MRRRSDPITCFHPAFGGIISERNAAVSFDAWDHETAAKAGDGMKKMWGSRFKCDLHELAKEFSYSLGVDHELLNAEIQTSMAHARMLGKVGLVSERESRELVKGLKAVHTTLKREDVAVAAKESEDIHTWIQSSLEKKIGRLARKLHTARSRNDLVSTSMRIYLREKIQGLSGGINKFQMVLVGQAEKNQKVLIPGYTHLQRAQVVLIAHHFLAYVEMFERDKSRLSDARKRFNQCPLGAAALAGSNLPVDRPYVAQLLSFKKPTGNSLDSVSDRDFVMETLSVIAILFTHLSRFCEDLILWNSQEFGFVELDDKFSTGSSLMPHKKNPDILELIRGKTGEAYGNLVSILTTMKGLPLAYNRDMQEDKKPLFASLHLAETSLSVLEMTVQTLSVKEANCLKASKDSFLFATDLVEYLVMKRVPFREAHDIVGRLVEEASTSHSSLIGLPFEVYRKYSRAFQKDVYDLFDPQVSVSHKWPIGSTRPDLVHKQIRYWKEQLKSEAARFKRARTRNRPSF